MSSDQLIIFDTTLRDGEQSPGIALTPSEKLLIAQQLEKLKVDVIEAGFAASSPGDWEGVNLIANNIEDSTIASLARCVQEDIEQAHEAIKVAKKSRIHVFTSTSDIHMEHMLRKTKEEVLKCQDGYDGPNYWELFAQFYYADLSAPAYCRYFARPDHIFKTPGMICLNEKGVWEEQ